MRACLAVTIVALLNLGCLMAPVVASSSEGPARSGPFSLEVVDEAGATLPTYESGGRTYVLGSMGRRYALRIRNDSGRRVEFVASVDGRDVLDGRSASFDKRGYIVNPYGDVVIDGFRTSNDSVASFRFSSVGRSYAARMGDARDVGVIGVAVFSERRHYRRLPPAPDYDMAPTGSDFEGQALGRLDAPAEKSAAGDDRIRGYHKNKRPGLGTEFGEERESQVYETEFERASGSPDRVLSLRYDDAEGLRAMGVDLDRGCYDCGRDLRWREDAQPFRRDTAFAQPPPDW